MQNTHTLKGVKTPATTLPDSDSDPAVVARCRDCGVELDTPVPAWLAKWPTICDGCAAKQAKADQHRIRREAELARLSGWHALCPASYRDTDIAKLPRPKLVERVLSWPYGPRGLLLHGKTGLGKSRCAWLLMKREYDRGRKVAVLDHGAAYEYAALFDRSNQEAAAWVQKLSTVALMLLDDVFKAKFTDSFEQGLFTIVASRCEHKLPIIATTNDLGDSLQERMTTDRGAAMVRRLRDHANSVAFV